MDELMQLHFIRPWWLLFIPVLALLSFWFKQQSFSKTGFEQWIDPVLLRHLQAKPASTINKANSEDNGNSHNRASALISALAQKTSRSMVYYLLALLWCIAVVALAGPSWKQLPQPLHQSEQAMVIVLDLSPSMLANDNKPSRIVRARIKIQDLLSQRKEGLTALVVYAGESHIVTPLTNDINTIINLLPTLTPGLLPIPGSNIEMAVQTSTQLIRDSGLSQAAMVIVTDGIDASASNAINNVLNKSLGGNIDLFILGLGTPEGAPIPASLDNSQGDFLRDANNNIVTAARNDDTLKRIAQANNGTYLPLQANDSDIQWIVQQLQQNAALANDATQLLERNVDQWEEWGPSLLLWILPLAALAFRRGWLLLVIVVPTFAPQPSYALSWSDLWLNNEQQAQQAFQQQNYSKAQEQFKDHQWQGSAAYKNQQYQAAIDAFSQGDAASDYYNKGNAHAQLGQFDEAIQAYDTALAKNPDLEDAKKNKATVERLKQQQEEQKQEQQQEQENQQNQDGEDGQEGQNSDQNKQDSSDESRGDESGDKNSDESNDESSEQNSEEQDNSEQTDNAQEENSQASNDEDANEESENQALSEAQRSALANLSDEEKYELEQWLGKIPDDPSGLLRRKFEYEFQQRREQYQRGEWTLPDNNAHQRY